LRSALIDGKLKSKIDDITLSNNYYEPQGDGGFEKHKIYAFSGIRIHLKDNPPLTLKKGDTCNLPKSGKCQIFGFEINIGPNGKLHDAYFLTRHIMTMQELEYDYPKTYQKFQGVKMDQKNSRGGTIQTMLKKEKQLNETKVKIES
jgi:hypothetical protein